MTTTTPDAVLDEDDAAPPPADPTDDGGRLFPVRRPRLALEALLVAGVSWAWAVLNYRLWDLSPRVPVNMTGDARLITNLVKNSADQGWWTTNPDLGYPIGQQLYDFPHGGETWQLLVIRILGLFTKSPGLIMNLYFFVGIGVLAVAAYLALRHLRFGVGLSLVAATALTWLPFRLGHGQWHLFRTSFWWVPLAVVIVLWTIHWRERFLVDADPPPRDGWRDTLTWTLRHNLRVKRVLGFGLMLAALGMAETMTTSFTMVLLALTGLLGAIRRREPVTLLVHGAAIVVIAAVFFVGMASTLRFVATHGTNAEAGRRLVVEQELYGLKLSDMLLPDPSHRQHLVEWGEASREVRDNSRVPSEGGQSIGLLGAAGFVGAVVHVLTRGWGARRRDLRPLHDRESLRDDASLIAIVGFLVATISGGAIFLSLMGFSQVRVWNRMSLLIAVCSLIYALTWLEGGWARLRRRFGATPVFADRTRRVAVGTVLTAVLVAGVIWDGAHVQFRRPGGQFGLDYAANDAQWTADAVFAEVLDEAMPDGSAVFQFPIIEFPEAQVPLPGRMKDYDHLRAWVHLPPGKLKWSYGAMKGRPDGDWQIKVRDHIGEVGSLPLLIGLGFDAVWVDTFGYDDGGARVANAFDEVLGDPIISADMRVRVYDLTPLKEELAAEGRTQEVLAEEAERELNMTPGD